MTDREAALAVWRAALAAGDVRPLVRAAVRRDGRRLSVGPTSVDLNEIGDLVVLGCGKASAAMARTVEEVVGDRVRHGFVVVKDGYAVPTGVVEIAEAGHPVPDERGQAAARRLVDLAHGAGPNDLVLVLVSGGASALAPAPAPPVTLVEKQAVTRLLLGAGATIDDLNAVRKHLSLIKGGQLARAAAPARTITLLLSDVIGDPIDVIGSGPTAPDPTTFGDALRVLTARGVSQRTPAPVLARLTAGARGEVGETPKPGDPVFERVTHVVIGNNALVVDAAREAAERLGYRPVILSRSLSGEARETARAFVAEARRLTPPACLIAGGETTVTVRGGGRGGRCQEFALAAALELESQDRLIVLAAGTDGTDGPTDAAGGVVDATTIERARRKGGDARHALEDNDAYNLLGRAGDLIVSGPTHTNLLDLYMVFQPLCPSGERSALSG